MRLLRKFWRSLPQVVFALMVTACGQGVRVQKAYVPLEPTPLSNPQPGDSACTIPLSGILTRLSAGTAADVVSGSTVQWQLTLNGGCSTQYSLDGGRTLVANPFVFQKTYTQTANGFREQVTATAVYATGRTNPLTQVISSDPFNITAPTANPLVCNIIYPSAPAMVPIDVNGNITTMPLPAYNFGVQIMRNNVAVAGRITDVQSLTNPALPFALPTGYLPTPELPNTTPISLPVIFAKAGFQVLGVTVAAANPAQTGYCVLVFNIMGQLPPPPVIQSFTASTTTVVEGASVIFTWATGGTISECKIYGSLRGYSSPVPTSGSLQLTLSQTESFRLSCRELQSDPITVNTIPRPASISLDFNADNHDPNNPAYMRGQPSPAILFQNLGLPGGRDYGQFFYPGVETASFVSQQLGIDPSRCPQTKLTAEGVTSGAFSNIMFSRAYANGNPMAPLGNVGVFAFGHGGATTEVAVQTNFRTISLRSTFPRFGGVQSPFIFTNGFKVVLGLRTYENFNTHAGVLTLVPGEYVISFSNSMNVFDNAGLGGGLWKAVCN